MCYSKCGSRLSAAHIHTPWSPFGYFFAFLRPPPVFGTGIRAPSVAPGRKRKPTPWDPFGYFFTLLRPPPVLGTGIRAPSAAPGRRRKPTPWGPFGYFFTLLRPPSFGDWNSSSKSDPRGAPEMCRNLKTELWLMGRLSFKGTRPVVRRNTWMDL